LKKLKVEALILVREMNKTFINNRKIEKLVFKNISQPGDFRAILGISFS